MREYWILTKIQLLSLFGINKIRFSRDQEANKKGRRGILMLLVVAVAFGNMSVVYSGMMAVALKPIGALPLMLGLMSMAATAISLLMTIFSGRNVLFSFGDYDVQMSWPVSAAAVAASRFTTMYAYNAVYSLLLLLPAGVIYATHALPPLWFYPLFFVLSLFVPAIPTAAGCLASMLIAALTAGRRRNAMLTSVFQIVAALAIMFVSMQTPTALENLATIAEQLSAQLSGAYPFAIWFQNALTGPDPIGILLTVGSGAAAIALTVLLLSLVLKPLSTRLLTHHHAGKAYRTGSERRSGIITALFRKEIKRYFASPIYVTNTLFGMVILVIGSVVVLIVGPNTIRPILEEIGISASFLPLVVGVLVMMSCTTVSSISMEGKQLWIVKSLPVPVRELFLSKVLVNVALILIPSLIGSTLLGIALGTAGIDWLYLYLLPIVYVCFDAVFGLAINLRMPKLDWKNETEVVKQSAACFTALTCGMLIAAIPLGAFAAVRASWILPAYALLLSVATLILWQKLLKSGQKRMLLLQQ